MSYPITQEYLSGNAFSWQLSKIQDKNFQVKLIATIEIDKVCKINSICNKFEGTVHNKIVLIDAVSEHSAVITGSFNFTWAAQHKNAENILIVRRNIPLASQYASNWERHRQDATPYAK